MNEEYNYSELSTLTGLVGDPILTEIVYPSSESVEFKGWNQEIPSEFPDSNMYFYPILGGNSSVTFKADPGTFPNGKKNVVYIGEIGTETTKIDDDPPPDPSRTGYAFNGWDKETPERFPTKSIEINSTWKANTSNLKFDYNGGKIGSETSSLANAIYDSPWPEAPDITTPKSYTVSFVTANTGSEVASTSTYNCPFNGYWSSSSSSGEKYYNGLRQSMTSAFRKVEENLTAYAGWTNPRAPASGNFADLIRDEYAFDGWYSDVNRTNRVYNFDPLESNTTIYAKWTQITSKPIEFSTISTSASYQTGTSDWSNNYTLTVPISSLTSVPGTLHLKKIYFTMYVQTDNNKITIVTVTFPGGQTRSARLNDAGESTVDTLISGDFTNYDKNKAVTLNINFFLEGGHDVHSGKFSVKITKLIYEI